ncbi:hypothetical protein LCGC14_2175900 [marine sediment metagenome]|uniref:Uncharacterized protein n=1 Tax=marine sediment metagenome TaxID=412755 RepID=A0A0F9DNN3_9ZZZZ
MAKHTCLICDKTEEWGLTWSHYGSLGLLEYDPKMMLKVCSDECKEMLTEMIKEGSIEPPKLNTRGGVSRLVHAGKGY